MESAHQNVTVALQTVLFGITYEPAFVLIDILLKIYVIRGKNKSSNTSAAITNRTKLVNFPNEKALFLG